MVPLPLAFIMKAAANVLFLICENFKHHDYGSRIDLLSDAIYDVFELQREGRAFFRKGKN
jgi:hypothetical protein